MNEQLSRGTWFPYCALGYLSRLWSGRLRSSRKRSLSSGGSIVKAADCGHLGTRQARQVFTDLIAYPQRSGGREVFDVSRTRRKPRAVEVTGLRRMSCIRGTYGWIGLRLTLGSLDALDGSVKFACPTLESFQL